LALAQEAVNKLKRVLMFSPFDADGPVQLPPPALRANRALLFDALGVLTVGNPLAAGVLVVSAYVQTLLGAADQATLLAGQGWSNFMASLRGTVDGPTLRAAIGAVAADRSVSSPQGRLTLVSGGPAMTVDQVARSLVYYTPSYSGYLVPLWNGTSWAMTPFAEVSNDLTQAATGKAGPAAAVANSIYDMFVWSDNGTLRLSRGPAWVSNTDRGAGAGTSELNIVQGLVVNKVAITNGPAANVGVYVGSIRTNGTATVDFILGGADAGGRAASIGVWNAYNRLGIGAVVQDTTFGWAYNTNAWRPANASTALRVSVISGLPLDALQARYDTTITSSGSGTSSAGIGLNSTTVPFGVSPNGGSSSGAPPGQVSASTVAIGQGFFFLQALESTPSLSSGSMSFFGGALGGLTYKWSY
jgi:hypothetical protein